jgi:hypothetical protein
MMATFHLPDGTSFEADAKLRGRVEWTAEGRKELREESGISPDLICELEVAKRFGVSVRTIRERARARGLGRKIDRVRRFYEAEIVALMDEGTPTCSKSSSGQARLIGTSGARSTEELFTRLQKRETKQMLADLRQTSKLKSPRQPGGNVTSLRSGKPPRSI